VFLKAIFEQVAAGKLQGEPVRVFTFDEIVEAHRDLQPLETRTHVLAFCRWMCIRSRFAEDLVERAIGRGVEQYLILGAGLDSFAYRPSDLVGPAPSTRTWQSARPVTGSVFASSTGVPLVSKPTSRVSRKLSLSCRSDSVCRAGDFIRAHQSIDVPAYTDLRFPGALLGASIAAGRCPSTRMTGLEVARRARERTPTRMLAASLSGYRSASFGRAH
jgi:Leucine carboxyl methyltransferase